MSEKLAESNTLVSHWAAIINPDIREQYRNERVALIKSGAPTWMIKGFNDDASSDWGHIYDFYMEGKSKPIGYIEGSIQEGFEVYGPPLEEDEGPHHLNTEPVGTLNEAQKKLEEYIEDTHKA